MHYWFACQFQWQTRNWARAPEREWLTFSPSKNKKKVFNNFTESNQLPNINRNTQSLHTNVQENNPDSLTHTRKSECRISLGAVACANIVYCLEENIYILDLSSAASSSKPWDFLRFILLKKQNLITKKLIKWMQNPRFSRINLNARTHTNHLHTNTDSHSHARKQQVSSAIVWAREREGVCGFKNNT